MILKLIIATLSVFVTAGYLIALWGEPYLFIILFPVVAIAALILGFLLTFLITKGVFWKLLGCVSKRDFTKDSKLRVTGNIFIGFMLFVLCIVLIMVQSVNLQKGTGGRGTANPSLQALKTLPYLAWTPAEKTMNKRGVTKYDPQKAFRGINVYASVGTSDVHLIDMKGKRLHTWSAKRFGQRWQEKVQLCQNGDLLGIVKDKMLMRLDWDSNVKWTNKMRCHHEIILAPDGDIYVLGREDKMGVIFGLPVPVLNDYIAVISPDGKTKRKIPLLKAAREHIPFDMISKIYRWLIQRDNRKKLSEMYKKRTFMFGHGSVFDIFHNNTITIINKDINGICRKGDLLVCIRELDLVGILDFETAEFIWTWGPGELSRPHHPTLLENGNILIFDNGRIRGYSRVIELEPVSKEILWEYKASPPESFYSKIRGSCQRLPNSNTLITESDKGHVFEVTRDGRIVWEFYNPDINMNKKRRAVIYRMARITDPENYPQLKGLW